MDCKVTDNYKEKVLTQHRHKAQRCPRKKNQTDLLGVYADNP